MRFNDSAYVNSYIELGVFPSIHKSIVATAIEHVKGKKGVDLCCSHGLLGQQMMQHGFSMMGVDGDKTAVKLAREQSISMPITLTPITRKTLQSVLKEIQDFRADFVVARRCLPELFGNDLLFGDIFFAQMKSIGIKELVIQGRVKTAKAVNPLSSIDAEISLVSPHYKLQHKNGDIAYLSL